MPQDPSMMNKDAGTGESTRQTPGGEANDTDPNARLRPDQAQNPNSKKVKMQGKASPTKPQQVHDENVNRA